MKFILAHAVILNEIQVKLVYVGHHVKVSEQKKVENLNSRDVKLRSPITVVHICDRLYQHVKPCRLDA